MRSEERQAMSLLAHLLMQNGLAAKSVALLEGLDVVQPGHPPTLRALAVAQLRSSQPAEALQTLDRLALLGDTLPVLGLLRAQGLLAAGRKEEAQIEMAQFLARRLEKKT